MSLSWKPVLQKVATLNEKENSGTLPNTLLHRTSALTFIWFSSAAAEPEAQQRKRLQLVHREEKDDKPARVARTLYRRSICQNTDKTCAQGGCRV